MQNLDGSGNYCYCYSVINMTGENGVLSVYGDMFVQSANNDATNVLTEGTLELGGNFSQIISNATSNNFKCKNNHKVKFTGTDEQIISFESTDSSGFNILLPSDNSNVKLSGSIAKLGGNSSVSSFTQYQTLDLNGYKLNVENDLNEYGIIHLNKGKLTVGEHFHPKGTLYIEDGTETVKGSCRMQALGGNGYVYAGSSLNMTDPAGLFTICGDMYVQSSQSDSATVLNAGTLELKGNFYQYTANGTSTNFNARDLHKVLFTGNDEQEINVGSAPSSGFAILAPSENDKVSVSGRISKLDGDSTIGNFTQKGDLDLNGHTLTVTGNMTQLGNIHLNGGTLIVKGNYLQSGGTMYVENGKLNVSGDYLIRSLNTNGEYNYTNAALNMTDAGGYMTVGGDFVTQSALSDSSNVLTAGTLELNGNFTQLFGNGVSTNFSCAKDHKTILTGEKKQKIYFEDRKNSYFGTLEINKKNRDNIDLINYSASEIVWIYENLSFLTADEVEV